jgi:hypothetical protein
MPSSLRSLSICSSSFFETAIAPIMLLIIKHISSFVRRLVIRFNRSDQELDILTWVRTATCLVKCRVFVSGPRNVLARAGRGTK